MWCSSMAEIISLPSATQETYIWVCECGCTSFELMSDDTAVCALCGTQRIGDDPVGGWYRKDTDPDWDADRLPPVRQIGGNREADFAKRVTIRRMEHPDVVAVVVLREDGAVHTWSRIETHEQVEWAGRRFAESLPMLRPPTAGEVD